MYDPLQINFSATAELASLDTSGTVIGGLLQDWLFISFQTICGSCFTYLIVWHWSTLLHIDLYQTHT